MLFDPWAEGRMGDGRFVGGKLTFLVSADAVLPASEKALWLAALRRESDFVHAATGGQVQFGDIYVADDNFGRLSADALLLTSGTESFATRGQFGVPAAAVLYAFNDRGRTGIFSHELAHHVWNLGDEYSGPMEPLTMDTTSPTDLATIPVAAPLVPGELVGYQALITFSGNETDRRTIVSNTAFQIGVAPDFTNLPTTSPAGVVYIQRTGVHCGAPANSATLFCIMSHVDPSVTAFCEPTNHEAAQATDQQAKHGQSCWETIISAPDFTGLSIPTSTPALQPEPVNFIDILKEKRFVVAIDRSGSMAGDQLAYAKEGARFWIDSCALADDQLSLIAYNASNTVLLSMTQVSAIPDQTALHNSLDALTATGQTNVRDALREAVIEIQSVPGRAVDQAVVVLTDGKHNRPPGSRLIEALPDLTSAGVRAATIAIGDGTDVDAEELDELAYQTNGYFSLVGLSNPIDIETALIEANLYLRGELVASETFEFVPAPVREEKAPALKQIYGRRRPPRLNDVCDALGIPLSRLRSSHSVGRLAALFRVAPFFVEQGCERIACTVNHSLGSSCDVFLIPPDGSPVVAGAGGIGRAAGPAHTLLTVSAPAPGGWRAVVLARMLDPNAAATVVNVSVGAENRRLTVVGGTTRSLYRSNERPRLYAQAVWTHPVTNLRVDAHLRSESSALVTAPLRDGEPLTAESGRYVVDLPQLRVGHYHGVIRVATEGPRVRADQLHSATHAQRGRIPARSDAPRFSRTLPVRFQVTKGR